MRGTRQIVVSKRDGTLERFSLAKLTNSLARAMRDRLGDPRPAKPLAKAVALHLQAWQEPNPPTTGYIYRCVRSALQQTGLGHVADGFAAHRRRRRARRRGIRVLDPASRTHPGQPWSKGALVATLRSRYGLRHAVSRFVAGQIEQQVFALDYRTVLKPLLAELVRNELLAWGLADEQVLRPKGLAPVREPPLAAGPQQED